MFFLMSLIVETMSGFIVLLPMMVLLHIVMLNKSKKDNLKVSIPHIIATYIFGYVLLSILSATGIPNMYNLLVDMNVNLIPFIDILTNYVQYLQNIALFVPLGFLLPMIWKKFEKKHITFLTGLLFSLAIEIIQIFSFRATDIDDLFMNTIGTILGYLLFISVKKMFPQISIFSVTKTNDTKYWRFEQYFLFSFAWVAMFFIQPFISSWLWNFIL